MLDNSTGIKEYTYDKNRVFILKDASAFKMVDYKVMNSQEFDWIVKTHLCHLNGNIELFSVTGKYSPLPDVLPSLERMKVFMIIKQICKVVTEIETHGFLSVELLLLDISDIYYDPSDGRVRLIYLPAEYSSKNAVKSVVKRMFELIEEITTLLQDYDYYRFFSFNLYMKNKHCIEDSLFYETIESGRNITHTLLKKVISHQEFDYLPPLMKPLISMDKDISFFTEVMEAEAASQEYDYIVVDTGKEYSREKAKWIGMSDVVLLVTEENNRCRNDCETLCQQIVDQDSSKYYLICNRVGASDTNMELEGQIQKLSIKDCGSEPVININKLGENKDIIRTCFLL